MTIGSRGLYGRGFTTGMGSYLDMPDLHISIEADPDHEDVAFNCRHISGSVRLRLPMIGGGSFESLMPALIDGIRGEWKKYNGEKPGSLA